MSSDHPDFRSYSTRELREVLGFIDREKFPGRVEEILKILAEREHSRLFDQPSDTENVQAGNPQRVIVDGTSIKSGRSYSLMDGIVSIVGGTLWLWAAMTLLARNPEPTPLPFKLFFYLCGFGVIFGGFISIYNAFAKNRFSLYDMVSTEDEPDPLSALLEPSEDGEGDDRKT